ncbi:FkbM family methyltransferase [Goodfellowiella coeruleoviolacea]|uniref:FkbM family methyltransferase n=1 Tax=Goodfellowiella coeruleoviolacea TaxID=334858 RepID=UPI0020A35130|nr:FkbM family methyltransferase [Goodfellowiella coeruleoviolacea]
MSVTQDFPAVRTKAVANLFQLLARFTPWVEPELLGLRAVVRPGDVCLDVGAALGYYTAVLADLVGPQGTVHSVEPLLFAHPALSAVLRPRSGPNIVRHSMAFGQEPGRTVMRVPVRNGVLVTGRSFVDEGARGLGSNAEFEDHVEVNVRVETIDQFAVHRGLHRLDFVKGDVEGAELSLLHGARKTIERFRPSLLLEIEARHTERYGHSAADVADWLRERGYQMSTWSGTAWRPVDRITTRARNYLFTHPDRRP